MKLKKIIDALILAAEAKGQCLARASHADSHTDTEYWKDAAKDWDRSIQEWVNVIEKIAEKSTETGETTIHEH